MSKIEPIAGDPSTEPVATGAQSHVAGRVGPPTIAQDAATDALSHGVTQIEPGTVLPAETPHTGPVVPKVDQDDRDDEKAAQAKPAPRKA